MDSCFDSPFIYFRDAEWELEPQAFSELLERPTKCEAVICKCTEGRDYSDEFSWKTTRCRSCGSLACHVLCMDGQLNYLCELCTKIVPQDAECLQSEVVESELDDIDGWDTESEDEILNPPWSSKKIGSKKVRKIIDSGKDKEEKKILFYKNEMLKLGKHKIKKCSVLLKDCELKDKNVTETVKEADKLDEVEDSLMSSCASYVDRLSPLPIDKIQCSLITSSKNNGKTEGVFEDLKKQLMVSHFSNYLELLIHSFYDQDGHICLFRKQPR